MAVFPASKTVTFASVVAVIFGLVTVAAGSRVLLGSDPGYTVFRPLLLFNTAMGLAYIVVGVLAWRRARLGVHGAALVALVNLVVFGGIAMLYAADGSVAITSLQAMALRTIVWVVLFLALLWSSRQASSEGRNAV